MYKSSNHDQLGKEQLHMDEIKIELDTEIHGILQKTTASNVISLSLSYHFPLQSSFRAVKTDITAYLTVI